MRQQRTTHAAYIDAFACHFAELENLVLVSLEQAYVVLVVVLVVRGQHPRPGEEGNGLVIVAVGYWDVGITVEPAHSVGFIPIGRRAPGRVP